LRLLPIVRAHQVWEHPIRVIRFRALKHRNFQLFFAGQLVSLIGTWMQSTAQLWLVYRLTNSPALLGISDLPAKSRSSSWLLSVVRG